MRERRDRAGFALEARERLGVIGKLLGNTLIATSRPRRRSFARYTSPMPPAPRGARTSYRSRRVRETRVTRGTFTTDSPTPAGPTAALFRQDFPPIADPSGDFLGVEVLEKRNRELARKAEHLFELSDLDGGPARGPQARDDAVDGVAGDQPAARKANDRPAFDQVAEQSFDDLLAVMDELRDFGRRGRR